MNSILHRWLPLPAVRPWQARFSMGLWLLGLVSTLALLTAFHGTDRHGTPTASAWLTLYCAELFFVWWLFPSGTLLLALDSHTMRIPGADRKAFAMLPWLALICIAPASAAFHFAGISVWTSSLLFACAIAAGLIAPWVPRWMFVIGCWMPSIIGKSVHFGDYLSPEQASGLQLRLGALLLVMLAIATGTARHYFRNGMPNSGLRAPMIVQFRNASYGVSGIGSKQTLALTSKWIQPKADIRRGGPARPLYSLRLLLGGSFNPLHWNYYFKILGLLALYPLLMVLLKATLHHWKIPSLDHDFLAGVFYGMFGSGLSMLAIYNTIGPYFTVRRRWSMESGDLALMALLPGLAPPGTASAQVLRTLALTKPALILASALLFDLVTACVHPLFAPAAAMIALILLTDYTAGIAAALHAMIHAPEPHGARRWLAGLAMILVASLGYITPLILMNTSHLVGTAIWTYPLASVDILVQLVSIGCLAWLARRCWHRLQAQPHPFLAR